MTSMHVPCTTPGSVSLFLSGQTLVAGAAAWAQRLLAGVLVKVVVGSTANGARVNASRGAQALYTQIPPGEITRMVGPLLL
jgi:hypothetical protein